MNEPKNVKKVTKRLPTASATDSPLTLISVTCSSVICCAPNVSCGTSWNMAGSSVSENAPRIRPSVSVEVISSTNRFDGLPCFRLSWISRRSSAWLAFSAPPCTDSATM